MTLENQPDHLPAAQEEPSDSRKTLRSILEIVQTIALAAVFYFVIDAVIGREMVQKISMEPTLVQGEILMVNKISYKFNEPQYGEIITFQYPLDPELAYVKRVIGLPGDVVEVKDGQVYVNDQLLNEPYISAAPEYEGIWEVPQDDLFVLGDNRNPSADSHVWGFVPEDNIIGKAFLVYWPVDKIRALKTPDIFAH
jgi:signal peptidase I